MSFPNLHSTAPSPTERPVSGGPEVLPPGVQSHDTTAIDPARQDAATSPSPLAGIGQLPEWLVKLGTESWQAELVISGFAIVGTLQLTELIDPIVEWTIFTLRFELIHYVRWAINYFGIGLIVLPAAFIAHFALRTYWVGLVGLSSVYPHGFGTNFGMVPDWIAQDTAAREPDLATQIDRVDRRSSEMFASAALLAMTFASISVLIIGGLSVAVLIERVTGGAITFQRVFGVLVGIVVVAYAISLAMLLLKRYHHIEVFRRWYLRLNRAFSQVIYTVFRGPATYLSTLMVTNQTGRAALTGYVVVLVVLIAAIFYQMTRPMTRYVADPELISEDALRTDRYEPMRYRDNWSEDAFTTLQASVPSEQITLSIASETFVPVFFPLTGEDDYRISARSPEPDRPDSLDRDAWRPLMRANYLQRVMDHYRFRLGESVVPVLEVQMEKSVRQREGLRFTIALPANSASGREILYLDERASVEKSDTSWAPRAAIPVWLESAQTRRDE